MAFKMGDLNFTSQAAAGANYASVADVMVGDKFIYVVQQYLQSVAVYNKTAQGLIGTYVRTINWYSNDNYTQYICATNSSVPYAYAVYVENGQDYLIGWSSSHNMLFGWVINPTTSAIGSRSQYGVADKVMSSYSRGGWDGGQYVYFWNRADMGLYRWNLSNKAAAMVKLCTIAAGGLSLDASYTGSGLFVMGDKAYWGSGSNESDGFMACFNINTGAVVQGVMRSPDLASFGVTAISGNSGCIQINPTNRGIAYYFVFGSYIKTLYLSTLTIKNLTFSPVIHNEDVTMTFDIANDTGLTSVTAKWRVLVNGVEAIAFNDPQPIPVSGAKLTMPNSLFVIGANIVTLEVQDNFGGITTTISTITVVNNQPTITTTVTKSTVHAENVTFEATVNDEATALDLMTYRVLLNGAVVSDWSVSGYMSPLIVRRAFRADQLQIGANVIRIEVKDNFKTNTTVISGQSTVTKVNAAPTVYVDMRGNTLYMTFDDSDGDFIRFRVLLNGVQVMPESGYSIPFPAPTSIMYTLPKELVLTNQMNAVSVEVIDSAGDKGTWATSGILGYSGLMFKDAASKYYTTDLGVLLKYLDIGVLYAREQSGLYEVYLENTLGYPVKDIKLSVIQGDLDPVSEKVEICDTNAPFIPQSELLYPDVYNTGDTLKFYIRLTMNNDAVGGGNFKIRATGNPI